MSSRGAESGGCEGKLSVLQKLDKAKNGLEKLEVDKEGVEVVPSATYNNIMQILSEPRHLHYLKTSVLHPRDIQLTLGTSGGELVAGKEIIVEIRSTKHDLNVEDLLLYTLMNSSGNVVPLEPLDTKQRVPKLSFTPREPGKYTLEVLLYQEQVRNSPFSVVVSGAPVRESAAGAGGRNLAAETSLRAEFSSEEDTRSRSTESVKRQAQREIEKERHAQRLRNLPPEDVKRFDREKAMTVIRMREEFAKPIQPLIQQQPVSVSAAGPSVGAGGMPHGGSYYSAKQQTNGIRFRPPALVVNSSTSAQASVPSSAMNNVANNLMVSMGRSNRSSSWNESEPDLLAGVPDQTTGDIKHTECEDAVEETWEQPTKQARDSDTVNKGAIGGMPVKMDSWDDEAADRNHS